LLSNKHVANEQLPIYRAIYTQYANTSSRPIILINWSDLDMHKVKQLILLLLLIKLRLNKLMHTTCFKKILLNQGSLFYISSWTILMLIVCLNILFWRIDALLGSVHHITLRNLAKYKIAKPLNLQMFGLADILPTGSCFFLCRAAL
jgi:hypothetical protein